MIISKVMNVQNAPVLPAAPVDPSVTPEFVSGYGAYTTSGKRVSEDTAKTLATAYRCGNILSDDIAAMPFQVFMKMDRNIQQVAPNAVTRNIAYLMELQPNRWMTPFLLKKTIMQWLLFWGNGYIWEPPTSYRELFILRADLTYPVFDAGGNLWYKARFPSGKDLIIPAVEMTHLMINSSDGWAGKSVISYARETMGRQIAAHETQNRLHGQGLNPAAILWVNGEVNAEARAKLKKAYTQEISGSEHAGGAAIFDNKIAKFEPVTMKASDAQFLESINATDAEIANFFGMPLYKLNMGKQSYESNEQQNLDYLRTTLNPYLVQFEQAARLRWLSVQEQSSTYFKFNRESLLQTDAKTRAGYLKELIFAGMLTPNEGRNINDMSAYADGDGHYVPANMMQVEGASNGTNSNL